MEKSMLRKATNQDTESIQSLYQQAITYLKQRGIDQWQNGYPNQNTLKDDIAGGFSYVYEIDHHIVATVAILFGDEADYKTIFNGQWLNHDPYVTIHRLVVDEAYKGMGVAQKMLLQIEQIAIDHQIDDIRIDTHPENVSMKRFLIKSGFTQCGIVYLKDGAKRIAFHKVLR
jgi:ribosomal protein S18 acetylase RimI-like enzyme